MSTGDPKGYYAALRVSADADAAAIKAAYRRRAMELHPDRNASSDATKQFQLLNEAYAVLANPAARAEYDTMAVEASEDSTTAAREVPEPMPIFCSCCGKVSAQPRYVIFYETVSLLLFTKRSPVQGIFCSACADKKALNASMLTWLFGWWGIPWGPFYSIHALWTNLLGGKRPALANARLAAHQAWFFATTGRHEMAHAVAIDAMDLARKIPPPNSMTVRYRKTRGYEVEDEGEKLRSQIQQLLETLGGSGGMHLKDAWGVARRPFFIQAAVIAFVVGGIWIATEIAPKSAHAPPRGPNPYATEPAPLLNPRESSDSTPKWEDAPALSTKPAWMRPAMAPNGQPWPVMASYVKGFARANTSGLSSVTVDNTQNDSDVFVKLFSLDGAVALPARVFYIPAHARFTVDRVTAGNYDVRYQDLNTGTLSRSEQFALEETETLEGTQYSTLTMTLYKVRNGNMRTYDLAPDEF